MEVDAAPVAHDSRISGSRADANIGGGSTNWDCSTSPALCANKSQRYRAFVGRGGCAADPIAWTRFISLTLVKLVLLHIFFHNLLCNSFRDL